MQSLFWLIHKDFLSECRARRVFPTMALLGAAVAFLFSIQMDGAAGEKHRIVGGLFWLTVLFSSVLPLDRSFAGERENGCWQALLLYPVPVTTIYFAKLTVNFIALTVLECLLLPMFVVLCNIPLLSHPGALLAIIVPANLGIAAAGTLTGALATEIQRGGQLVGLLLLPLAMPLLLGAAEGTRLLLASDFGPSWWQWVQLLFVFAGIFTTAGWLLLEWVIEQ